MKIGIIGSGNMGRTLGLLWSSVGHTVFFGARDKSSIEYINSLRSEPVLSGTIEEAVDFADVLLYNPRSVPSTILPREKWRGKILIDPNNGPVPADLNFAAITESFAERFQDDVPESFVIKAFNTIAQELYYCPVEDIRRFNLNGFISGNDDKAKATVATLVRDSGLIPLDCGMLSQSAKLLESFADLVRLIMIKQTGVMLGFSAVTLPTPNVFPYGIRQATKYN